MTIRFFAFTILLFTLFSCGTQKRLTTVNAKITEVKKTISERNTQLDSLQQSANDQKASSLKDSILSGHISETIKKLQLRLQNVSEKVSAIELLTHNKANFREKNYYSGTLQQIAVLDSFQHTSKVRDRIFKLLSEAIEMKAFQEFEMGIFFKSGAYKIPPSAIEKVRIPFQPAIDSLIGLSNKYSDIKQTAYLVFVGYADAMPISPASPLYHDLKSYIKPADSPTNQQLNQVLSALRANELQRNIRLTLKTRLADLQNIQKLTISHTSYGRGEALPFPNIKDYQANDERRRVVVFYWSVLPSLD